VLSARFRREWPELEAQLRRYYDDLKPGRHLILRPKSRITQPTHASFGPAPLPPPRRGP